MLESLVIRDFALIDGVDIDFLPGLNVLSGETGAGKSILIGALSFLLGGKADSDSIRTGAEEASVSGSLLLHRISDETRSWLAERGVEIEDDRILLRRTLRANGRGSAFIQARAVTRSELEEFTGLLFDIHGQHEHQGLLKADAHRRYLDRFAGLESEVNDFSALFQDLAEKRKTADRLEEHERERAQRIELLSFAIDEISKVAPMPGETEALEGESKRLAEFERLAQAVESASSCLFDQEESALPSLRKVVSFVDTASHVDGALSALASRIGDLFFELEDAADQLRHYRDDLRYEPERLEQVEERLQLLFRLKKKYGSSEEEVLAYAEDAAAGIAKLRGENEDSQTLQRSIAQLEKELARKADLLTSARTAAAARLSESVCTTLGALGMQRAQFSIQVASKLHGERSRTIGPYGADDVAFLISPNPGEPLKELSKIASGGELSRVMLALKTALAEVDSVQTMVFDEIDSGIGGEVALAVGAHLQALAKKKQVFCITHLATIAARADNNLKVEKQTDGHRTRTTVSTLEGPVLREELARMLAGDSAGDAALAHAGALLKKFSSRSVSDG